MAGIQDIVVPKEGQKTVFKDRINEINKLKMQRKKQEAKIEPEVNKDINYYEHTHANFMKEFLALKKF